MNSSIRGATTYMYKLKKRIGSGKHRIVYDIVNGHVLKVSRSKRGRRSNKKEVSIYYSSPRSVRKHLGRIKKFHRKYSWIKMVKYWRRFPRSKKYRRKLKKMIAYFRKRGIMPDDVLTRKGKPKRCNLRLKRKGKIVFIDYANFRFKRK